MGRIGWGRGQRGGRLIRRRGDDAVGVGFCFVCFVGGRAQAVVCLHAASGQDAWASKSYLWAVVSFGFCREGSDGI